MSYINDALRRLQKEKGSPYEAYGHIVGASVKKPRRYPGWITLVGILVLVCSAAAAVLYLNGRENKRSESVPYEIVVPSSPQAERMDLIDGAVEHRPRAAAAAAGGVPPMVG